MFLKNYTSDVPTSVTIMRIQKVLLCAKVSSIEMEYGNGGNVTAIIFRMQFDPTKPPMPVRMPAKVKEAQDALWLDYAEGERLSQDGNSLAWGGRKKKAKKDFCEQGERTAWKLMQDCTAWKLMQDWIEVQLSLIQLRQVDPAQVFLAYVWDGEQTFYDKMKGGGFKALMPAQPQQMPRRAEVVES